MRWSRAFSHREGCAALARRRRFVGDWGILHRTLGERDGRTAHLAAGTHDGVSRAADERARSGPLPPSSQDLVCAHRRGDDLGGPQRISPGHHLAWEDFLFPQMAQQDGKEATGWSAGFLDYLFLAFNTSTAFSPTDTAVLSQRAKVLTMVSRYCRW